MLIYKDVVMAGDLRVRPLLRHTMFWINASGKFPPFNVINTINEHKKYMSKINSIEKREN